MVSKYEYKLERVMHKLLGRFQKILNAITLGFYNFKKNVPPSLDSTGIIITGLVICWFLFMINFDKVPFNL